jgi:hypothetical protein
MQYTTGTPDHLLRLRKQVLIRGFDSIAPAGSRILPAHIICRRMKWSCRDSWSNARLLYSRLRFRYSIALACYNGRSIRMTHAYSTTGDSTPTRPVRWDSWWPACMLEPQRSAVLWYFDMRFNIPLITFDSFCLLLRHKTYSLLNATLHVERSLGCTSCLPAYQCTGASITITF